MTCFRVLVFLGLLLTPSGLAAQGLSPSECAELKQEYGLVGPGCGASPRVAAPADKDALQPADLENNVFFPNGGAALDTTAQTQLALLARVLATPTMEHACLRVVGHSDASGSESVNMDISLQRAVSVAKFLTTALGNPTRIGEIDAMGEDGLLLPATPNADHNRRVELQARHCATAPS